MNDNWIGEERILICSKCSFYKETAIGIWSKCGKLDDTAIETCGAINKISNPILLDGYDGKEAIIKIQEQIPIYINTRRANLCVDACKNFTDEFLEMNGIEGLIELLEYYTGTKKEDATYMGKNIWRKENG